MNATATRVLAALVLTLAVLSPACGYRGPLYLPDENPPGAVAESPAESEPAEDDDEDEDEGA